MEEKEIDLRDYINVITKRKKTILTVFLVAVITTAVVSLLMPRVYETASTIQIGSIDGLLMRKSEAKQMLLGRSLLVSVIKELNLDLKPCALKENIKIEDIEDTNLLRIKTQYPDSDMAVKINKAVVDPFISRGQVIYQERLSLINQRLEELKREIKNREEDIRMTQNLIAELPGSAAVSQPEISSRIILLQNILSEYQSRLSALRNQRNSLKAVLIESKDFEIVESAFKPEYPIKPRKTLNVAIAGVVSLMFGTFLAFFKEYWQSPKGTTK